jgi:putative phosphoribosyl transferase
MMTQPQPHSTEITIPTLDKKHIQGELTFPGDRSTGIVVFAHGSGSSRFSPRNKYVAGVIQSYGMGTLLMDLLTREEEAFDQFSREHRFNIRKFVFEKVVSFKTKPHQPLNS